MSEGFEFEVYNFDNETASVDELKEHLVNVLDHGQVFVGLTAGRGPSGGITVEAYYRNWDGDIEAVLGFLQDVGGAAEVSADNLDDALAKADEVREERASGVTAEILDDLDGDEFLAALAEALGLDPADVFTAPSVEE